jgi:LPXTG-site transpeptidase (sortase) family protein
LGTTKDGSLAVPNFFDQVGWYDKSSRPGSVGTVVLDGHYSNEYGVVFKDLNKVNVGDEIKVIRGDGQTISYTVESKEDYSKDAVPMDKVVGSDGKERLSIITCNGAWINSQSTFSNRLVVYALRK